MATAATLVGCTAVSDVAAKLSTDGRVEFLFCEAIDADRIRVVSAQHSANDPDVTYWRVSGPVAVDPGFVLDYGVVPARATQEAGPDLLRSDFVILAESLTSTGDVDDSVQATFDTGNLLSDQWLMADGRIVEDRPC